MSTPVEQVAFPSLSDEQLETLDDLAEVVCYADGNVLFSEGERDFSLFVVKRGRISITESSRGVTHQVAVHAEREFTGDVDLLTGRPSPVTARADGDCEVYRVTPCQLRRVLNEIPTLSDLLLEAFQLRRRLLEENGFAGIRIIGSRDSKETLRIREFLYKNKVPHNWIEADSPDGQTAIADLNADPNRLPVLTCSSTGHTVQEPCLNGVAECIGIRRPLNANTISDLTIVGAGPAGLAAAVYGASEGLKTLVLDRMGPGGQAGTSSRIENYMGFVSGLPGADLANRAYLQALKFGACFSAPEDVRRLTCEPDYHRILLGDDREVRSKAVLIASGASYRRLPIENCDRFEGAGVYYAATSVEARLCGDGVAYVIGGGNSAGQAAMFLSEHAREVKILIRGEDLGKSMSRYLCDRIDAAENIAVLTQSEIVGMNGDEHLEQVTIQCGKTDQSSDHDCSAVFVFIGARPHTEWLPERIATDRRGFVLTGAAAGRHDLWPLDREPCTLETTCPGVFAAGDVRADSTKRVAFAVGDGALAVTCAHQYLSELL